MQLPTVKSRATLVNPRQLILFGLPKSGKTAILSHLEDCLIVDIDGGTDYYDTMSVKVNNLEELRELVVELSKKKKELGHNPYKYIALDTITVLNDLVTPLAADLYRKTSMGKNFKGDDIRSLPNGAGYKYIRDAFEFVVNQFVPLCDHLIFTAHVRDKMFEKDGKEFSAMEVDLEGKLRTIVPGKADAVGYVYRKDNQTIISFITKDAVICGSRSNHLKNKEIVIAESSDGINIDKTYWDKIYI